MAERTMGKRVSPPWEEVLNKPLPSPHTPAARAPAPREKAAAPPGPDLVKPWQGADESNFAPPTLAALGGEGAARGNRRLSFRSQEDGHANLTRHQRRSSARRSSIEDEVGSVASRRRSQTSDYASDVMRELDEIERKRSRRNSLCGSIAEAPEEDDASIESGSSAGDAVADSKKRRQDEKLMKRVRRHKEIRPLVNALWSTSLEQRQSHFNERMPKSTAKKWSKAEYADFHRSICVMLTQLSGEEFDDKAAWETMLFDFDNDAAGKAHVTYDDASALLFEVAEMWLSNSTDPSAYIEFFAMLLEKTTTVTDEPKQAAKANGVPSLIAGRHVDLSASREWRHSWPKTPRGKNLMSPR